MSIRDEITIQKIIDEGIPLDVVLRLVRDEKNRRNQLKLYLGTMEFGLAGFLAPLSEYWEIRRGDNQVDIMIGDSVDNNINNLIRIIGSKGTIKRRDDITDLTINTDDPKQFIRNVLRIMSLLKPLSNDRSHLADEFMTISKADI